MADRAHPLSVLQRSAGNHAVQRLLAGDLVVQRYRQKAAMNFGATDTSTLIESPFKNLKTQPWISLITIDFNSVVACRLQRRRHAERHRDSHLLLQRRSALVVQFRRDRRPRGLRSDPENAYQNQLSGPFRTASRTPRPHLVKPPSPQVRSYCTALTRSLRPHDHRSPRPRHRITPQAQLRRRFQRAVHRAARSDIPKLAENDLNVRRQASRSFVMRTISSTHRGTCAHPRPYRFPYTPQHSKGISRVLDTEGTGNHCDRRYPVHRTCVDGTF
jgi:hypothetical protein